LRLKAWFDILTPKQVLFFAPVIQGLGDRGFEILATSRKYREVEPLAKLYDLKLRVVGERGGESLREQLAAATARQEELIPMVDAFGPDIAVSVASGVCARVSFGLGVKHLAVNDSPHSAVAGKLTLPLSFHVMCPWVIPFSAWYPFGISRNSITRYRALDPAAWLKRGRKNGFVPPLDAGKRTIVVRLEEAYAPYMAGTNKDWNAAVLRKVGDAFKGYNLVALCRYGEQLEQVMRDFGSRFLVPEEVVDGRGLLEKTDAFIGMGGTMSTESALMGVPTISTFQGSLFTERFLVEKKLLAKTHDLDSMIRYARRYLDGGFRAAYSKRARAVLDAMEDPVRRIADFIARSTA
jgi:uncharacterized protein